MTGRGSPSPPAGRQASVTSPAATDTVSEVRDRAEAHLRALVGSDDARLREDQWSAIEALAVHRRRGVVGQRTGWGK